MKRSVVFILSLLLSAFVVGPASPAAAAPYCGIYWGSLPKTSDLGYSGNLVNVRTGQHDCYDRLVLDIADGRKYGYSVRYVEEPVEGGMYVIGSLRGAAQLQIDVRAPAYKVSNEPPYDDVSTYDPANWNDLTNVSGYRTFRQVAYGGSFEATTTIGLGVRARLPFRVFVLDGPGSGSRLVIDVAHRW